MILRRRHVELWWTWRAKADQALMCRKPGPVGSAVLIDTETVRSKRSLGEEPRIGARGGRKSKQPSERTKYLESKHWAVLLYPRRTCPVIFRQSSNGFGWPVGEGRPGEQAGDRAAVAILLATRNAHSRAANRRGIEPAILFANERERGLGDPFGFHIEKV